ncbi:MAG: hypothetical protein LBV41_11305 [Cytophagaceae bacterium]|jgi:hypothetical protein|nr:hypothetical protein [Cytophagaceae bacterium]
MYADNLFKKAAKDTTSVQSPYPSQKADKNSLYAEKKQTGDKRIKGLYI